MLLRFRFDVLRNRLDRDLLPFAFLAPIRCALDSLIRSLTRRTMQDRPTFFLPEAHLKMIFFRPLRITIFRRAAASSSSSSVSSSDSSLTYTIPSFTVYSMSCLSKNAIISSKDLPSRSYSISFTSAFASVIAFFLVTKA